MNKPINDSMRMVLLLEFTLLASLAYAAPSSMQAETTEVNSSFSARAFCEQRGGTVTETGDRDVYVCCYKQKRKCLVSNTGLSQSIRVDFPWDAKEF